MITFKQYLSEGGHATEKYGTSRANQADMKAALKFVSETLGIPYSELADSLLGSTELTLLGKRDDSGDIDIAIPTSEHDPEVLHDKMMKALNNEGSYSPGLKVGSYAVPVGDGKKVQVDLMAVSDKQWAKFAYHSRIGNGSKYGGAVRNLLLFTALAHTQHPGKDFVIRDDDGRAVLRASHGATQSVGMKRLFKMAKFNPKTGKYNKTIDTVTPAELEARLKEMGKNIKFSHDEDFTNDPDKVAEHIFGKGVKAKDIMSAEDIIKHIKKLKNADEIISAAKRELERTGMTMPEELK